ncbi:MAG TPA: AI-2E family transporter [Virgibacillus sp.]|nr:AI-2E family transporter [Virgibacillus sp.]
MFQKRWFQTFVLIILIFLLIWLIAATNFIFDPIFKYIGAIAIPLIGAGILYYVTKPVMNLFERMKIPRIISILLVFLLLSLFIYLFINYIAPIAQKQFENLIDNIPKMAKGAQNLWESNQFAIPEQVDEAIDDFTVNLKTYVENGMNFIFGFIGQLISFVFSLILIPFFLFFMLKDGDRLIPFITQIFEKKKADNIKSLLHKIDTALTAFIQGQVIVSICVGVLLYIGYLILGLNYSLTLALFAMLMNVIPFLGPFIAVVPALLVGAFQSPMMIIWVAIVTLIAQQFESNFISPNVMGRVLHLHPLTVITVILAAGSIGGFLGILFAVPIYAVIKTTVVHFYQTYQESKTSKDDALI